MNISLTNLIKPQKYALLGFLASSIIASSLGASLSEYGVTAFTNLGMSQDCAIGAYSSLVISSIALVTVASAIIGYCRDEENRRLRNTMNDGYDHPDYTLWKKIGTEILNLSPH